MSTNQLFRDYLDGKIHVRRPFKAGRIYTAPVGQFLKSDDATGWTELTGATPSGYIMDETQTWANESGSIREVSMTMTIPVTPWQQSAWNSAMAAIIKRESQVNEMHALHGRNFDPSAEYDMPDSERHEFNWQVSQIWMFTGQSPEEIADILHRFGDSAHFHTAPAVDYDRDLRVAMAPRHGPPPSASWRGRGRVTKYKAGRG